MGKILFRKYIENFVDYEVSNIPIINEFDLLKTVTDKLVLRNLISIDIYNVSYVMKSSIKNNTTEIELKGLNHIQSVSVYCTPQITITLFKDEVPNRVKLNEGDISDFYKNEIESLRADGQALISMCEDRYDFEYFRYR